MAGAKQTMRGDDGGLFIHSFAHGGAIYRLRYDARSAKAAVTAAPVDGLIDYALAILTVTELEADELEEFIATVANATGIGKKAIKDRIKKEHREREQRARTTTVGLGEDGTSDPTSPTEGRRTSTNDAIP